jgi:cytochrome c
VTYTADAQPIFKAKCAPCHTVDDSGGSDFASSYAATQVAGDTTYCTGAETVGACTLTRIKNGSMPYGAGCTGNPTTDAGKAACLTAAEQTTLQAWITDGQED